MNTDNRNKQSKNNTTTNIMRNIYNNKFIAVLTPPPLIAPIPSNLLPKPPDIALR